MTEEERTCCILHKAYACLSADYFSNTSKWLDHFFFFFLIEMRALLLLNYSLPTTVVISPAYPEFTALAEVFSDEQVGERPVNRHLYKRFVKLLVLKGKNSWSKSQQCWLKCLKHCLNPLINPASQYLTWINSSEMSLLFSSFVNIYVASPMKYDA